MAAGEEHGYMPIVVRMVSTEDYTTWVGEQKVQPAEVQARRK